MALPREHVENYLAQLSASETIRGVFSLKLAWQSQRLVCRDHCQAHAIFRAPKVTPSHHLRCQHVKALASMPLQGKSLRRRAAMEGQQYQIRSYQDPL
jgi:hypothetical protein